MEGMLLKSKLALSGLWTFGVLLVIVGFAVPIVPLVNLCAFLVGSGLILASAMTLLPEEMEQPPTRLFTIIQAFSVELLLLLMGVGFAGIDQGVSLRTLLGGAGLAGLVAFTFPPIALRSDSAMRKLEAAVRPSPPQGGSRAS